MAGFAFSVRLRPQVRIAQKRIIHAVGKVGRADRQGKFDNLLL
jgi:hypothetical protein